MAFEFFNNRSKKGGVYKRREVRKQGYNKYSTYEKKSTEAPKIKQAPENKITPKKNGGPNIPLFIGVILFGIIVVVGVIFLMLHLNSNIRKNQDNGDAKIQTRIEEAGPWTSSEKKNIEYSWGHPDGNSEIPVVSQGKEEFLKTVSLSRQQLLKMSPSDQISILVNGAIRDEYKVAAQTLYGKDLVEDMKRGFEAKLLLSTGQNKETNYANRLTGLSELKDFNVVDKGIIDDLLPRIDRYYVSVSITTNLTEKVIAQGKVTGLATNEMFTNLQNSAKEFLKITDVDSEIASDKKNQVTKFYHDNIIVAIEAAPENEEFQATLGGFYQDQGVWLPNDMEQFSWYLYNLFFVHSTEDVNELHEDISDQ